MIDEWNEDGTGWARFSDDRAMRYRLARSLTDRALPLFYVNGTDSPGCDGKAASRVVFLMLNPSTADAFKLDPTIRRCVSFARAWGADVLDVVNIFALRSTDPDALYGFHSGTRGEDRTGDMQILESCLGARWVVAGWGKHGALDSRGRRVREMLTMHGIVLHHLGLNKDGSPKHPLYLKGGTAPVEWTP